MNFIVSHKCKRFVNEIQYANDNRVKIRHSKKQKLVVFKCRTLFIIDFSSSSSVIDFNHFWQTVRLFSSGNQNLTENFFFKFFLINYSEVHLLCLLESYAFVWSHVFCRSLMQKYHVLTVPNQTDYHYTSISLAYYITSLSFFYFP